MSVYFLEAVGLSKVKIGYASDVQRRVRDLTVGSPAPLALCGSIDGGESEEKIWHTRWKHLRSHGEWFFLTCELRKAISEACGVKFNPAIIGGTRTAWTFQDRKRKALLGDDAPWCVGWYDPDGKRKSKSVGSREKAEAMRRIWKLK